MQQASPPNSPPATMSTLRRASHSGNVKPHVQTKEERDQEMLDELNDIFAIMDNCTFTDDGEPRLPLGDVIQVFRAYEDSHNGVQVCLKEDEDALMDLLKEHPDMHATPKVLMTFVEARLQEAQAQEAEAEARDRGRGSGHRSRPASRSSSQSSPSKAFPPRTPAEGHFPDSPFDSNRRQRSTPLHASAVAPSSWNGKRPPPAGRRKSDAGLSGYGGSDTESGPSPGYGRRSRPPSNPTSPHSARVELPWESMPSPHVSSPPMAPHSRSRSDGRYNMNQSFDFERDVSLEEKLSGGRSRRYRANSDSSSYSEQEDNTLGMSNNMALSSATSLLPEDQLEDLRRANTELTKKFKDTEASLTRAMNQHELDIDDMHNKLEEAKAELSAAKREEKELRAKERITFNQISALEAEVAKLQKQVETSRASYQQLQKQYQEQCAESERYRNTLRQRDLELKHYQDANASHALDIKKYKEAQEAAEQAAMALTHQLEAAEEAVHELNAQKDENMKLKETIDRMRYEMDQLRTSQTQAQGSSGTVSKEGSLTRTLGMELSRMNFPSWPGEDEEEEPEEAEEDDEDTDREDLVETIITRRTRRPTRSNKKTTVHVESVKEYCDNWTQHEVSEFSASHGMQTDPEPKIKKTSMRIQTDVKPRGSMSIQTEPEPKPAPLPAKREMEIQTDVVETDDAASSDEDLASSSSTLRPPTPKPEPKHDLPPSYSQIVKSSEKSKAEEEEEALAQRDQRDMLIATQTIQKWHHGLHIPLTPIPGGVSIEAIEDWRALKEEIGIDCVAIDKMLEISTKTNQPRALKGGANGAGPSSPRSHRFNRFYNIYNTHVYGNGERKDGWPPLLNNSLTSSLLLAFGLTAIGVAVLNPSGSSPYPIPGGASSYDRQAWMQFNSMAHFGEGSDDGTAAVWDFIGRVGTGAARIAAGRAWPS